MIRLLAIDVDGTLLDSAGRVPQANLDALHEAAARGVQVAIVTGRSFRFALPAVARVPDPLTLVVHNGAIARTRAGETLIRRLLPRAAAHEVLTATMAWRDCALALFDRPGQGQLVYDRLDWTHPNRTKFRQKNLGLIEEVAALEDALVEDPIQIAFNGGVAQMRSLVDALSAMDLGAELSISVTEYEQRDFSLVDVCAAETTKGATLERLAALLEIPRAEVMAIGDNFNDRDMLEWAGIGVAMGNATPEVQAGFEVTGTNDDAGLASAIRKFVLA